MWTKLDNFLDSFCWATYARSFLITLGLVFIAFGTFFWLKAAGEFGSDMPMWSYWLSIGFAVLGSVLIGIALFANGDRAEKWANDASRGGFGIVIIMMIALPLYLLISSLRRSRDG